MSMAFNVVDYVFATVFLGCAVAGVHDMFQAAANGRGWILPAYAVAVGYGLHCALRAFSSPVLGRRARAAREARYAS